MIPDRFGWDRRRALSWPEFEAWTRTVCDAAMGVVRAGLLLAVWVGLPGWSGLVLLAAVVLTTFLVCVTAPIDR